VSVGIYLEFVAHAAVSVALLEFPFRDDNIARLLRSTARHVISTETSFVMHAR